ncbi:MAG: MXAN_6640 family putative metalloprotease [Candidatus Kapaibacterium sp.]
MIRHFIKAIVLSIAFFCAHSIPLVYAHGFEDIPTKCGTFSERNTARMMSITKGETILDERPPLPLTAASPSGRFLLHYTISGVDSVPTADDNRNGVPDWIDSAGLMMDYIYSVEVVEMGYKTPPTDNLKGGSDQYDIYFVDLSKEGKYGETVPEGNVTGGIYPRSYSFIRIDNNFNAKDSYNGKPAYATFGYDALKVTLAHEYHHAIQYGYGSATGSFHEMMSSWIEMRVYPEVTDYINYIKNFFTQNDKYFFGQSDAFYGYSYCMVLEYFHQQYGDAFVRHVWELVADGAEPNNSSKGLEPYRATDSALVERGSSLQQAWCDFLPWVYYTGRRAIPGKYFARASIYPEFSIQQEERYTPPSFTKTLQIKPFQIQFTRCILPADTSTNTPDSAEFLVTYPSMEDLRLQTQRPGDYTIVCSQTPQPFPIAGTNYSYDFKTTFPQICRLDIIRNGTATIQSDYVYPNPFHAGVDDILSFPAPSDARVSERPYLAIYTVDWRSVFAGEMPITTGESSKRVLAWKPTGIELSSNVYIYTITIHGNTTIGKFSVISP